MVPWRIEPTPLCLLQLIGNQLFKIWWLPCLWSSMQPRRVGSLFWKWVSELCLLLDRSLHRELRSQWHVLVPLIRQDQVNLGRRNWRLVQTDVLEMSVQVQYCYNVVVLLLLCSIQRRTWPEPILFCLSRSVCQCPDVPNWLSKQVHTSWAKLGYVTRYTTS
jgi:hypothetical protein